MGNQIAIWRHKAGVTRGQMATAMGLEPAIYEDLEAERVAVQSVHLSAAKLALLRLAVDNHDGAIAAVDAEVLQLVLAASRLVGRLGDSTCG